MTLPPVSWSLPAPLEGAVRTALADAAARRTVERIWARDAAVWTGGDEASWLGWLDIADRQLADVDRLRRVSADVQAGGFSHVLLLGMGGSSLCPEVLAMTFGQRPGFPELRVLDSTDPAQVRAVEQAVDPDRTLFIVASKSGSTLEPNIFMHYFLGRLKARRRGEACGRFVAITDPGSALARLAAAEGFRHTHLGLPSIGGRYSALSDFGMVPAAAMGVDVAAFLDRARAMATACRSGPGIEGNPGAALGILLGALAGAGRDKVTVIASPGIQSLGAWLEQLLAESTGKNGTGLIPVDREPLGPPAVYGPDRVFAYLRLAPAPGAEQDRGVEALARAGHPVIRFELADRYDIAHEFFRWEFATAVAGAVLGINPFDQPDVEASKLATRELTDAFERAGSLPGDPPLLTEDALALHADPVNAAALIGAAGGRRTLTDLLRAHLGRLGAGDYFALLGYVEMSQVHEAALQDIRRAVRDRRSVATCVGFGPRFLHSTGQAYKGGPASGVFLQITCDDAADLPVPGQRYTFGVVKAAQAAGDFSVLAERGRRALRVHLGRDVERGLARLARAIDEALG